MSDVDTRLCVDCKEVWIERKFLRCQSCYIEFEAEKARKRAMWGF